MELSAESAGSRISSLFTTRAIRDMASRQHTGKLLDYQPGRIIDRFLQFVYDTRTIRPHSEKSEYPRKIGYFPVESAVELGEAYRQLSRIEIALV